MAYKNRLDKWSWRVYPLWLILLVGLFTIIFRLAQLQLFDAERGRLFLQQQGDARVVRNEQIPVNRAEIVDRNGYLLAFSSPVKTVWANPRLIDRDHLALNELAKLLDLTLAEVEKKLSSKSAFVYLRRQMDPQQAELIAEKKYSGIFLKTEYKR
ncbi:MAG: cell division protein, partial [Cellvibrionales bacterium]|nr:cell division protein [Cellvibrionales bacterium]